ncbi:MAG: hypothetical protein ABH814_02585 [bacterium]
MELVLFFNKSVALEDGTRSWLRLCHACHEKFLAELKARVGAGERAWCSRCGAELGHGFDYAWGVVKPGAGLCQKCFEGAVDTMTATIQNQPGGPLKALIVDSNVGIFSPRAQEFAQGEKPTEEEFSEAMSKLVGGGK